MKINLSYDSPKRMRSDLSIVNRQGEIQFSSDQTLLEVVEVETEYHNLITSPCAVMLP